MTGERWSWRDFAVAAIAPWAAATAAGAAVVPLRYDLQGWVASAIFLSLLIAGAAFTSIGRRAPMGAYGLGIVLTPLLLVAGIATLLGTGNDDLQWFAAALNVGYHPSLGPDFDGIRLMIGWCGVFGLLSAAALTIRQILLLCRERRLTETER